MTEVILADMDRKANNILTAIENELNEMNYGRALNIIKGTIAAEYNRGRSDCRADCELAREISVD